MIPSHLDRAAAWLACLELAEDHVPPAILWQGDQVIDVFGPIESLLGPERFHSLKTFPDSAWKPLLQESFSALDHQASHVCSTDDGRTIRSRRLDLPDQSRAWLTVFLQPVDQSHREDVARLRRELEMTESRFKAAVEGSSVGILEFDLSRPEWVFSEHVEKLLGFEPGAFGNSRQRIRQRIHPDDIPTNDAARLEEEQGRDSQIEIRLKTRSGVYRWFSIHSRIEKDDAGRPIRILGTMSDIDDLKKAQLESDEGVQRRDRFLAMLSHEMRNPMAAITFSLDCLEALDELPEETQGLISIIARQTSHMSRLLRDLLDVSRINRNHLEFEKTSFDLGGLVPDAIDSVIPSIEFKQQQLVTQLASDPLPVFGDQVRLKQALVNLLDNASKYTPARGRICIETKLIDDLVYFSVTDNGAGIPVDQTNKLFDLFYQAATASEDKAGIGLGLFLVDQIVRAHDGAIQARSNEPDPGSTFTICIPRCESGPTQSFEQEFPEFFDKHILLVDDNVDSLTSLASLLRSRGFTVNEYLHGDAAFECLDNTHFSVAIIDVDLPGKTGIDLALEIRNRKQFESALLVALTSLSQLDDREAILAAGFDLHLVKPTNFTTLTRRLAEAFAHKS